MFIPRLNRYLLFCLVLYVLAASLYTTKYLVSSLYLCLSRTDCLPSVVAWVWSSHSILRQSTSARSPTPERWMHDLPTQPIYWNQPKSSVDPEHTSRAILDEDTFLSKAFSQSMHPSKLIPFYYRANGDIDPEDITITTLVTSNRFNVFAQLVELYQGPVSVTVHVDNSTVREVRDVLSALHALYISSPAMLARVDVHLVLDVFDRQFNTWRNAARLFARTELIMMLDVDFAICTDFRAALRESTNVALKERLRAGTLALVVPAFEYVKHAEGTDQRTFPRTKESLLSLVKNKRIGPFHQSWAAGHNGTDYPRYYSASPGSVYKVTAYTSAYEPYSIFARDGPPWCDERFVGYGGNKAACLFEMYLSGMAFFVLADHFIIHQNHAYEESARRNERKQNRRIYAEFKEETCLRYLKTYRASGLLNTTRGQNLQDECKKIKGLARVAAQIIEAGA